LDFCGGACPFRKTGIHPASSAGQAFSGTCAKIPRYFEHGFADEHPMTLYGSRGEEESEYLEWRKKQPLLLPPPEPSQRSNHRPPRQVRRVQEQCRRFFQGLAVWMILLVIVMAIAQVAIHS